MQEKESNTESHHRSEYLANCLAETADPSYCRKHKIFLSVLAAGTGYKTLIILRHADLS
jgi:hypothetical protein